VAIPRLESLGVVLRRNFLRLDTEIVARIVISTIGTKPLVNLHQLRMSYVEFVSDRAVVVSGSDKVLLEAALNGNWSDSRGDGRESEEAEKEGKESDDELHNDCEGRLEEGKCVLKDEENSS